MAATYNTFFSSKEDTRRVCLDRNMFSLEGSSSPWEKDSIPSQKLSTILALRDNISPMHIISFSSPNKSDLQKELEICQSEKRSLEEQLNTLREKLTHNTNPISQRVFSDNEISIRIKSRKRPIFKVVFEKELYSVCWHGIELGYSVCRDGLLEEVNQTLVFLWRAYVKYTDVEMTRSALKIKRLMQYFFEEIL